MAAVTAKALGGISSFEKLETKYSIRYKTGEYATLNILNNHVFRYYMSPTGHFLDYPTPLNDTDTAKMNIKTVEDYGNEAFDYSFLEHNDHSYIVETEKLKLLFNKLHGTFTVHDKRTEQDVLKEQESIQYSDSRCTQTLHQNNDEYFFGGGMHNGMFTHKGEKINIDYTQNYAGERVTSPKPFYWSTKGYGVMRNTWQIGCYNFGSKDPQIVNTDHEEGYFDAFYFINCLPVDILNDYYELTGSPIFMPEYAFYEAHINTFNNMYWHFSSTSGRCEMHCDNGSNYEPHLTSTIHGKIGILGSLNGEKTKYEFSARFMIDWYKSQDMPLGWFVPNNESGYGQTDSFDGDLENLKKFVEYANENGVEVALWTGHCFEPNDCDNPEKEERDLTKEMSVGVVALKCDKECNYYGLNAVENATKIFINKSQSNLRPFIIMCDGWAGIQRYAGIWTGEQTGAIWEYIRFHIPTLIGAGLSGLPVVGSVVDGAYGGGDIEVNIREFQWKIFTPFQLNLNGWGRNDKIPFSYNCIESIRLNQASLKLKSMLMPYNYTISHESIQGLPMIRAMFLEFPKESPSYTKDSQYQYMWGPNLLIAPVYANKHVNCAPEFVSTSYFWVSNDFYYTKPTLENTPMRDGVYLPDPGQVWIDLLTGDRYQGGKIYNNIKTPLWKIPIFVKDGAIIPLVNANNNPNEIKRDHRFFLIYPNGTSTFKVYEDDGKSSEYLEEQYAETTVTVNGPVSNESGNVSIQIRKTIGSYQNMVEERSTTLQIMASKHVENIKVSVGEIDVAMDKVETREEYDSNDNVYYHDVKFITNSYLEVFGTDELHQKCLCIKIEKTDVTKSEIRVELEGFSNKGKVFGSNSTIIGNTPKFLTPNHKDSTATTITLRWDENESSYYEIERDENTIFSNIVGDKFTFKDFTYESQHSFRIRSGSDEGVSEWSDYLTIKTKGEPYKDIVEDIIISCSIPCEHQLDVCNLIKPNRKFWHTDLDYNYSRYETEEIKPFTLSFDLNDVHEIRKIEYLPREDAGSGTILKVQYRHSIDRDIWTDMSPVISWDCDDSVKVIDLEAGVKFHYFELDIINSVLGSGSGRNILFYKS